MATLDDVRRIALHLPGASEGAGPQFAMGVTVKGKHKGFVWSWMERVDPKKARVISESVVAVRTPGLAAKDVILASDEAKYFTEPHYNGYPAVLVRLEAVNDDDLTELLEMGWRTVATKELLATFDEGR